MASNSSWPLVALTDAGVELLDCVHKTPPAADAGYPYVAIPQMKAGRLELNGDVRRVSKAHFREWTRKALPQENDVVLSRRCNPGETAAVPSGVEFALGQNLVLLRSDGSQMYPPYLRWAVRGPAWWREVETYLNVGAVFDSLRCADVPKFRVPLPPLSEQRAIAAILGALDDKIELNRKMNETLEQMAQAIFKSWFIDFDGHTEFQDSELGRIPKGWWTRPIRELCEAVYDGPHATPATANSGPIFLGIRNMTGTGLNLADCRFISEEEWPRWTKRVVPTAGDIVFTYEATLGHFALIPPGLRCCLGRRMALVRPDPARVDPDFLFRSFVGNAFQALLASKVNPGSTVDRILLKDFPEYMMVAPPRELAREFGGIAHPLHARIAANDTESAILAELRDTLLPKLISGELRIKQAEKLVGEVT